MTDLIIASCNSTNKAGTLILFSGELPNFFWITQFSFFTLNKPWVAPSNLICSPEPAFGTKNNIWFS